MDGAADWLDVFIVSSLSSLIRPVLQMFQAPSKRLFVLFYSNKCLCVHSFHFLPTYMGCMKQREI